jgi:hypothetical protein
MFRGLMLASGLALGATLLMGQTAVAATLGPASQTLEGEGLVASVQWRSCRRVRRDCSYLGYGWRYRRCVRRAGCRA